MNLDCGQPDADTVSLEQGATLRSLAPGQLIAGRFRLECVLGRGGVGVVWKASDESLGGKPRALKFLAESIAHDQLAVAELKEEVARCQELTHPNILRVHDLVEDSARGLVAVSMEIAGGGTINSLRANRPYRWFEPDELKQWVIQLCAALEYAHSDARIVHRDLKPANLLLDDRRRLKVADFGIAHALVDSVTRLTRGDRATSGTPAYMSPQQASGKRSSVSDDIYALGATLYDLLTGKPPYLGGHHSVVLNQLLDPNIAPPHVVVRRRELQNVESPISEAWEEVISSCLSKDSDARPASAGVIASRLVDAVSYSTIQDAGAEVKGTSKSSATTSVALPHPKFPMTPGVVSLPAASKPLDEPPSPDQPPRKRGCTVTFAITFGLTAMLGAYFVQETSRREKALQREAGIPSAAPPLPDAQPPVPAPDQEHQVVPTPAPQREPPDVRLQQPPSQKTIPIESSAPPPAATPRPEPTPREPSSVNQQTGIPKGQAKPRPKAVVEAPVRLSPAAKRARAESLAREGTALLPAQPFLAKAKAEEALRLWPECPQAKELLRRVKEELARNPRATPLSASPPPRPLSVPGG